MPVVIMQVISHTNNPQVLLGIAMQQPAPRMFVLHCLQVYPTHFGLAATQWDGRRLGIVGEVTDFGATFTKPHAKSLPKGSCHI